VPGYRRVGPAANVDPLPAGCAHLRLRPGPAGRERWWAPTGGFRALCTALMLREGAQKSLFCHHDVL